MSKAGSRLHGTKPAGAQRCWQRPRVATGKSDTGRSLARQLRGFSANCDRWSSLAIPGTATRRMELGEQGQPQDSSGSPRRRRKEVKTPAHGGRDSRTRAMSGGGPPDAPADSTGEARQGRLPGLRRPHDGGLTGSRCPGPQGPAMDAGEPGPCRHGAGRRKRARVRQPLTSPKGRSSSAGCPWGSSRAGSAGCGTGPREPSCFEEEQGLSSP